MSEGERDSGVESQGRGDGRAGENKIRVVRWMFVELERHRWGVQQSWGSRIQGEARGGRGGVEAGFPKRLVIYY